MLKAWGEQGYSSQNMCQWMTHWNREKKVLKLAYYSVLKINIIQINHILVFEWKSGNYVTLS